MGKLKRHSDQLHLVWLLHWRRWERKGANVRGDGEGGRKASAQIGSQAHRQPRQSIFLILISRVFSCQFFVCVSDWDFTAGLKCPEASANHHLPLHTFSGARLFLAQLWETVLPVLLLFISVSWIFNGKWRSAHSRMVSSASWQSKLYLSYASPRRQPGPTSSHSTTRKYPARFWWGG